MKNFDKFINEDLKDLNKKYGDTEKAAWSGTLIESIFKTQIDDVWVYGMDEELDQKDVEVSPSDTYVYWRLEPDMRKDRIKSMNLSVAKVECNFFWSVGDGEETLVKFDSTFPEFKDWNIVSKMEFEKDGGVSPENVDIDYRTKTVEVS